MMPGRRVTAVFGFCDIRKFTTATEYLEEEVMIFVNTIGSIVHKCVHRWSGVPNKNIGDAFLIVWKMPEAEDMATAAAQVRGLDRASRCAEIADRALIALLKIVAECRRCDDVKAYSVHPRILARLAPGETYNVALGFGLHVGWAIEGPIG